VAQQDRSAQTGAYLRMLLVRPGGPRSVWEKHAPTASPAVIDVEAVAESLRPYAPGGQLELDVVRDALGGNEVSPATVDLFVEAFDLGPRHAGRLYSLIEGSNLVRVITGDNLNELHRQVGPRRHDTLALHEMHTLGPDGLPAEHQTIQVIKSTVDNFATYPYRFDTDELAVEVVRGGHVGDMYRLTNSLYGVDIVLDRPLAFAETALMHYRTTFLYRTAPPPEFRRAVLGTMTDVTMWVQFHRDRLPAQVWVGRWDSIDHANILDEQPVELDGEFSVQARYDRVENAIIGFHWSWD
jgi:hypothetical protein